MESHKEVQGSSSHWVDESKQNRVPYSANNRVDAELNRDSL